MRAGHRLQGALRRNHSPSPCSVLLLPPLRRRLSTSSSYTIPGRATRRGCRGFYDRLQKEQEEEEQEEGQAKGSTSAPDSSSPRMLTTVLAKAGWEVGALSFGLPRRPHGFASALETTLMAAVVVAKQNFIQVYDASSLSAEEMGLSSCRALTTLLQTRSLVHREELVTCATLNQGHDLNPVSITKGLDRARAVTGLETIDMAIIKVDLGDPRTPRGQPLLESLQRVMECLDTLAGPSSSSSSSSSSLSSSPPPFQFYGIDLRLPFYMQPKSHQAMREEEGLGSGNDSAGTALTPSDQEEMLLPGIIEEAALIEESNLALVSYPIHLTSKHLVTLPLMAPEGEGGRQRQVRPVSRLAHGALVGYTDAGDRIPLSSQLLSPATVNRLNATLNELSPTFRSSPLLEAKILRSVLAAEIDIIQLDVEDMLGLLPKLSEAGGGLVPRKDRLRFQQIERVFEEFYLPAM